MKVTAQPPNVFTPIEVTIRVESEDELNALYQIGNYQTLITEKVIMAEKNAKPEALGEILDGLYVALKPYVK